MVSSEATLASRLQAAWIEVSAPETTSRTAHKVEAVTLPPEPPSGTCSWRYLVAERWIRRRSRVR